MSENRFDEEIRKALEGYGVEPSGDVWTGIEASLSRRARWRVIRRVAGYASAAAACLVAGLLLFNNGGQSAGPQVCGRTAAVSVPVPEEVASGSPVAVEIAEPVPAPAKQPVRKSPKPVSVPPVGEQINNLADAYASNSVPAADEVTVSEPEIQETPGTPETCIEAPATGAPVTASVDWNAIMAEDEENSASIFGTPILAISSNITSNSSSDGFSPDIGPGHSPSREGTKSVSGLPVPVNEPYYYLPLSLGVQLKLPVSRMVSFGAGVNYSYLVSRYASLVNGVLYNDTYSQLHYVGVPVGVYLNLLRGKRADAYISVGGEVEKCVGSRYVYGTDVMNSSVPGLQFSVMAGLGVEYWLTPSIGCYLDPSLVYYFANAANPQPLSIRTAEPMQIRFEAGLRFRLHRHPARGRRF